LGCDRKFEMSLWITFIALVFGQIVLAGILRGKFSRWAVWLMLLSAIYMMHWISIDESGFLRMILICSVLMASMKAIVYREWCADRNRHLGWMRWIMFSCLWFGMDPSAFVIRKSVEWKSHAWVGGLCVVFGLLGVWVCFLFNVRNVVILFIFMSLGFHFGVLRLMTAFWRMQGFPVRALFRNPLKLRGFRDFWGKRWNLSYSYMMARAVKKPLAPILGDKGSMFAVFIVSGLVHELAITVPVGAGYGWPTLFFVVHGVFCVFEKRDARCMAILCGILLILGLPYLFGDNFLEKVILPSRNVMEIIQ
jgi:hypothetical protein